MNRHRWNPYDDARLLTLWRSGAQLKEICYQMGEMRYGQVRSRLADLQKAGHDVKPRHATHHWTPEENEILCAMWEQGFSARVIGARLGLSEKQAAVQAHRLRMAMDGKGPSKRSCPPPRVVPARAIIGEVCSRYCTTREEIAGPSRMAKVLEPRQIAMTLCYRWSGNSTTAVGRMFGGRDHTTVVNALRAAPVKYAGRLAEIEEAILATREAAQ